ncbi:hypothetical protein [Cellulomonas composti]|uniref:Uncharacterized protein n=1 Tax=Cellulomonas composti TaxID=266130 RepID=A0A511JBM2_9CELL|nr:hypothetical protein [Cellulomonas composti]GEL95364.1 hypothetical protein CCO02nite_20220 [Cellulomonas composti]
MGLVTDLLELLGGLLLVAAVVVALWIVSPALGLLGGGVALVGLSWLISWATRRKADR